MLEPLEPRRLLAAFIDTRFGRDELHVHGTRRGDVIELRINSGDPGRVDVSINHATQSFPLAEILYFSVYGGRGNDASDDPAEIKDVNTGGLIDVTVT
jgi:hypothetical protein